MIEKILFQKESTEKKLCFLIHETFNLLDFTYDLGFFGQFFDAFFG